MWNVFVLDLFMFSVKCMFKSFDLFYAQFPWLHRFINTKYFIDMNLLFTLFCLSCNHTKIFFIVIMLCFKFVFVYVICDIFSFSMS